MKTIEERAKKYASRAWSALDEEFNEDQTTYENIVEDAFIAGAKSERKEMLQWDDHIEDNLEMAGKSDHIGEVTEKVDWDYWRRMYVGMAMKAMMDNYNQNCDDMTEEPVFASFVARRSVFVADAIIDRLKKTQK